MSKILKWHFKSVNFNLELFKNLRKSKNILKIQKKSKNFFVSHFYPLTSLFHKTIFFSRHKLSQQCSALTHRVQRGRKFLWNNRLRDWKKKKWNYWFSCFHTALRFVFFLNLPVCGYRTNFFMLSQTFQQLYCKRQSFFMPCILLVLWFCCHCCICEWARAEDFGGCYNNEFIWYAHKFVSLRGN